MLIIPSKSCWLAPSRAGARGGPHGFGDPLYLSHIVPFRRCTASNKDLDGPGGRRSQRHTEALFEAFDHKTLWDDYGVIPEVLARNSSSVLIAMLIGIQPFTWTFPRADIHELLSPDLLHQVIKGTFKDHLVTWVGEYLEMTHGKSEAKKIMADIDRRYELIHSSPPLNLISL